MSNPDRWLLPDGVEEVLPPEAAHLESVRRKLLDRFASWGYELVITPMVEYLESLLTGTGKDLDLRTFKVTDQISGRMMGIRADITPQVARIDAHSLKREGQTRLCYAGTVLHTKPENMLASRTPVAVGAELFGDTGTRGDLEIVSLMVESIRGEDIHPVHLELGDVGIFKELVNAAGLTREDEDRLFELIQRKAMAELRATTKSLGLSPVIAAHIAELPRLCGGLEVLDKARAQFAGNEGIGERLQNLVDVAEGLAARFTDVDVYYDLSELRGYNYHTGIVFAGYVGETGQRLAKGGRYDHVGEVFGRSRAATGFDIDLKMLARHSKVADIGRKCVRATPGVHGDEAGRWSLIRRLRAEGYVVIESAEADCAMRIEFDGNRWQLMKGADPGESRQNND